MDRSKFNNNKSRRGNPSGRGRLVMPHPQQFSPTRVIKCRYRFKATALSAGDSITGVSILDILCVATGAAAASQLGNFFRMRKVEIWGPMAQDLVPVTVQVEWPSTGAGAFGKSVVHSDTSMGSSEPAHVISRPPPNSQATQWMATTASILMIVKYPANAIIDFTYDLVLRDDASNTAVTGAVAGATVGALYVRALNSPTNNNLVPVSVATI